MKTFFNLENKLIAHLTQPFIRVLQNLCSKSIRKFPRKLLSCSFLQCTADIFLGMMAIYEKLISEFCGTMP